MRLLLATKERARFESMPIVRILPNRWTVGSNQVIWLPFKTELRIATIGRLDLAELHLTGPQQRFMPGRNKTFARVSRHAQSSATQVRWVPGSNERSDKCSQLDFETGREKQTT